MGVRSEEKNGGARSAALELRLLGAPQIIVGGAPLVELTSVKAQALLFYLAVTGRTHARSDLAVRLWGDLPRAAALGNLRKAVKQLRKHLGAYLLIDRHRVALAKDADCWVDAVEFDALLQEGAGGQAPDRLQRAIDLYQGDFLEGFYVRRAPDFERWWLSEQAHLREMMLGALQALADHRVQDGDLEAAIGLVHRFLDLEPWREEAHRRLMTWLALSGQRGAALAQYKVCRRVLADELDVEPAAETTALYERIRDGDLRSRPTAATARLLPIKPQRPAFLDEARETAVGMREPFVGREPQLARLKALLEGALAGRGQVAFVSGEAGWGKTRLLEAFARRAQEIYPDLIVASGACTTFIGEGDPYLPFREMLRMLSADVEEAWAAGTVIRQHAVRLWRALPRVIEAVVAAGPHLLDALIPGDALLRRAAAHGGVEPGVLGRLQDLVRRGRDGCRATGISQEHVFAEVAAVLRMVSEARPLLLILDDLHWADASSVSLLFHLGRQLTQCRILLLGAYRPEDIPLGREGKAHPLAVLLGEFKRLFGDVWVHLGEEQDQGRSFVDALLDSEPNRLDERFRNELAENTRGHPLFTVETLRDLEEHDHLYRDQSGRWVVSQTITWDALPQRVEGVIERRINRLDARLRGMLETASVEGEGFTAEVVARVRQIDPEEIVALLSGELVKRHRLVLPDASRRLGERRVSRYRFSHHLFQWHLYHVLDPVERVYLHEAVAEALEALYEGATEQVAVQLARHFQEAGRPDKAVAYFKQAGDTAARVYANVEAIAHYGQAIDLIEQVDVDAEVLTTLYAHMGRAFELNSQHDQALVTYREMEELARQRADRAMELTSLVAQVTILAIPTTVYDAEAAVNLGERALALSRHMDDRAAEAKSLSALAMAQLFANRHSEAIDSGERSLALARELGLREQTVQTLGDLGAIIYLHSGRIPKAIEALEEVSGLYEDLGDQEMLADSLSSASAAHVFAGDYDRAIALSERALAITESIGVVWGQSVSQWKIGLALWERGQVRRAITVMEASIRLAEVAGIVPPQTDTRADLAALYGDLGSVARGIEIARAALSASTELTYPIDRASALAILGYLHALEGDTEEARARMEEAREDPHREVWPFTFVRSVVAEGRLTLHQRDYQRCLAATDALRRHLARHGMRIFLSEALWLRGEALLGLGRKGAAREALSQARMEAEAIRSRRMLWRILHALSRIEEDRTDAERLRQEAREILRYIVGHIDQTELRASFLSLPDVRAVLRPGDPV